MHPEIDRASVAALAGRRVDANGAAETHFPLSEVIRVAEELRARFEHCSVGHLICSAACGADLLALESAIGMGISISVVLPSSPLAFRSISVVDRPGDWGPRFDSIIAAAEQRGSLNVLQFAADDPRGYQAVNEVIVQKAKDCQLNTKLGFVVWDGKPRGASDSTAHFMRLITEAHFQQEVIGTLGDSSAAY